MSDADDEPQEECKESPGWLTTWADMMSVLLTFFIVLQAFSTLSEKKFFDAMASIQRAFRVPLPIQAPGNMSYESDAERAEDFEVMLEEMGVDGVKVEDEGDRYVFTVDTGFLFGLGKADLSSDGRLMMAGIAKVLDATEGNIRVEGHTDDVPIRVGGEWDSNWWLSCARALSSLDALQQAGIAPERLSAAGYGQYDPVAPNDRERNRRRNRRVEFVVEKRSSLADTFTRGQ